MPESKSSPRRILAREKQRQALELRLAGVTFETIAQRVGYATRDGAHKAVTAALQYTLRPPADELRAVDLERLDKLTLAIWQRAIGGDLDAIHTALRILAQRARLLGLEIPVPTIAQLQVEQDVHITVDHRQALLDSVVTLAARAGANGGALSPDGRTG